MCKNIRYNLCYNPSKMKDKIVTDYLEKISASETDEIKSILYKIASGQFVLIPNVLVQNQHVFAQNTINTNCVNLTQNEPVNTELHKSENLSNDDSVLECADSAQEEAGSAVKSFFG